MAGQTHLASLCVATGIPPLEISRFMGRNKVTTTLGIYAHLFADDHSDAVAALDAMAGPKAPREQRRAVTALSRSLAW